MPWWTLDDGGGGKVREHSLGVTVAPRRPYKTGWPMPKRERPRPGQTSSSLKL